MTRRLRRLGRWRRRIRAFVFVAVGLLLVAPTALAKNRGTDVLGNISPESLLGGSGSLVDRYPLSAYSLDYHVDVGIFNAGGVTPSVAQWAAAQLWSLTSFLVRTVIDLFTWAFSLDLLGGGPGRAGQGALAPVAHAISSLYENVIGQAWMVVAILVAGIWGIWKALVQRRYTETAGALTLSVVFVLIALFFVYQPERTIGQASQWTNTLSLAFLSGANRGTVDDPGEAKRQVADELFGAQIYQPWVVLEFGGLSHCVDTDQLDDDGFPRPVGPHDPARDVCRDHVRRGADGHGGYANRFLEHPPGSKARDDEYEALKNGETPAGDRQFAGYAVDRSDAPAVDIQQAGGAFQRLTVALVVFAGSLGMIVLLGFLSLAVILAQVVALVLLGFAPVALVIGIFPGGGHDLFRSWLGKLATAIFVKALYSLVIAIVVAVSAALASSTASLGFLFSFALQAVFFWAIFVYRRQISARLVAATTGGHHHDHVPRMTAVQRGARAATRPVSTLLAVPRRDRGRDESKRQQSVLAGDTAATTAPVGLSGNGAGPATAASGAATASGVMPTPVSSNGSSSSAAVRNAAAPRGSSSMGRIRVEPVRRGDEASPRAAHEAVMQRAREWRRRRAGSERPEGGS